MIFECFERSTFKVDGVHVSCENFALTCLEQGEHKATIEFHIERDLIVTWPCVGPDEGVAHASESLSAPVGAC